MDIMRSKNTNLLRVLLGSALGLALTAATVGAQQVASSSPKEVTSVDPKTPAPSPTPAQTQKSEGAEGPYTVVSSIEIGYRGLRVDGDINKYQSDLNYKAGPRIFDSSLFVRSNGNNHDPFDSFLMTSTGWGADPYGHMRVSVEKTKWYRFDGQYRRFHYFNFLNNLANPNFATQPTNPATGEHGYNTNTSMGDFDLTLLPKNEKLRFNVGISPERYSGPAFTTYHQGGDDFLLLSHFDERATDYRVGADWRIAKIDFSFLQGFRRNREDNYISNDYLNLGANPAATNPSLTSVERRQPVRSNTNYSRMSLHTLIARKLDLTGRFVYSSGTSRVAFNEQLQGINYNTRVTGVPTTNILTLGTTTFNDTVTRPSRLFDFGATYMATDKLRFSNTVRVESFSINGAIFYTSLFNLANRTTGVPVATVAALGNLGATKITTYHKFQDTVEGDYQWSTRFSFHLGYRYGSRRDSSFYGGFDPRAYTPTLLVPASEEDSNHTNAFIGGFKARPVKSWTLYFDTEHGTADNVFTRVGNYDYTNFRARSRYAPNHKLAFNTSFITRDNSNPGEVGGVSLADFGVNVKSRIFSSTVDWTANSKLAFSGGYNYNWVNSDAVIDYYYASVFHPQSHSRYYQRNNFFFLDTTAQILPRLSLYAAYRINKDKGQGDRLASPTTGLLITSYPMSFQSPEGRLSYRVNRHLDLNAGYQYYNYNESDLLRLGLSIRPQNYHAHQPYASLRFYFGNAGK
jgi:hypothetical protein